MKHVYTNEELKAIKDSIKHWKEDYKELELFDGTHRFWDIFDCWTCTCCACFDEDCTYCPLVSCHDGHWRNALIACGRGDKKAFMRARRSIIGVLERAYKRGFIICR